MSHYKADNVPLTALAVIAYVDRIEPYLRRTIWPPMTYMIIPSVLDDADTLMRRLRRKLRRNDDPWLRAQLERLTILRKNFKREA